jgi:molecular chaperone GrpE
MESIKKQFMKVLVDYGVEELAPKTGDKFDVNVHNALFEIEPSAPEHKSKTIGLVVKNGWARKGFLLRPAAVGVYSRDFSGEQSTQKPTPEDANL